MKYDLRARMREKRLFFEGGCGTVLQSMGLLPGEAPESWNLTHPERIKALHEAYLAAGCHLLKTNTFGANPVKCDMYAEYIAAAVSIARSAAEGAEEAYVVLDIGPTGKLLEPLGPLSFEAAVAAFGEVVEVGVRCGVDAILIETMNDAYETKAAVVAAKERCDLPVFVTNVYDGTGKLMTGADAAAMVALLEGLRVDAIGMNCSLGPKELYPTVKAMREITSLPMIVCPNAGLPTVQDGKTVFSVTEEVFSDLMTEIAALGIEILGGCCGTTPAFLAKTVEKTKAIPLPTPTEHHRTVTSSYTHAVVFDTEPILIGERINPTGKAKCKAALREGNMEYMIGEALKQAECGVQVLDVNAGLPDIDEPAMLTRLTRELQAITDLPLQLDSSDPEALARAMRIYNGKPMVNSVNGKEETMAAVFPLVQKYGGVVIALTLDEGGIPETAEARAEIAHRILGRAAEYGISRDDIIVDPLTLTVSSDPHAAEVTLETVRLLHNEGIHTSLGVSNVSFGLPARDLINAAFFSEALASGLSAAIMNPYATRMMEAYRTYRALHGLDGGFSDYIAYAESLPKDGGAAVGQGTLGTTAVKAEGPLNLHTAILRGVTGSAPRLTEALLQTISPMDVINGHIIPALDAVGKAYDEKKLYLPQLIGAADAATAAFGVVRSAMEASQTDAEVKQRPIILATVEGDVHDIGKNIVRAMLESYGFAVMDLGKNVPPDAVLNAVKESGCRLVGLSALMTTTVPAMERTIVALHAYDPEIRVVVGGAVLTASYAREIGADGYGADAMETVRYAESFYGA